MKKYEKIALVKFMSIYMISSFILFVLLSIMYYYDQKSVVIRELQDEMIAYISLSRNGNNKIVNNDFKLELKPSAHYQYPIFYEKNDSYISITCASKYQKDKVFIISADKDIINKKLYSVMLKIVIIMGIAFLSFLIVAFYLAKISIKPLQESRKMVDDVIEDIIHDLNAPMSAISINCESLKETISVKKERKKIIRIEKSNKTIKFLYKNLQVLLDKSMPLKYEIIDVSTLVKDRAEFYNDLNPEVKFNLVLEPFKCKTDVDSLQRVLDNLLSNAIKYSQPSPVIDLTIKNNKIIIEDNGIGIKNCSKIFTRHYRESHVLSNACGLGLGLSIVQRLCSQLDISIEYQTREEKGSRFILHCPKDY